MHVHFENSTTRSEPFWLTRELIKVAQATNPALPGQVRFSVSTDLENIESDLSTANVLVTSSPVIKDPRFPRHALTRFSPHLQFIHLIDAGVEDVMPLSGLPANVQLINNSGVHVAKAREFLIMAILALNSRWPRIMFNQRQRHWEPIFTPVVRGKCLLVVGLGHLGGAAVSAGLALNMRILGVRRSGAPVPGVEWVYLPQELPEALAKADIIVICTPVTVETRNLFNRTLLSAAKPGAALINIARGDVLDHDALVDFLHSGHLSGAVLDVLPEEPLPPSSILWRCPNLMINPRVGADDPTTYMDETMRLLFDNLHRLLSGAPLRNVIDRINEY